MANRNDRMMVAYYANDDAAKNAAAELQQWDKANADVKLGAIALVTLEPKTGKLNVDGNGLVSTMIVHDSSACDAKRLCRSAK